MSEGRIVPYKVADAAQIVANHLGPQHPAYEALKQLVDAPHALPTTKPYAHAWWSYIHHRMGDYSSAAYVLLEIYLVACAEDARFSWSDVLGKHSEIEGRAREFDAEIYFGDEPPTLEHDCSYKWEEAFEEADEELKEAARARVAAAGPFTPDTDFDLQEEICALREGQIKRQKCASE